MARKPETVALKIRIGRWAHQQIETAVAGTGLSVSDEVASIVQAHYQRKARALAFAHIDSTVKAADSTSDAIEELMKSLEPFQPSVPPEIEPV